MNLKKLQLKKIKDSSFGTDSLTVQTTEDGEGIIIQEKGNNKESVFVSHEDFRTIAKNIGIKPVGDSTKRIEDSEDDIVATITLTDDSILQVIDGIMNGSAGEPHYYIVLKKDGEEVQLQDVKDLITTDDLDTVINAYKDSQEANQEVNINSFI